MKNLIKHILKEETNYVDPKKIDVLKKFVMDYFSNIDWFRDFDFEIGSWKSAMSSSNDIPEIKITIYISDVDGEIDFSDFMDEIDFLMDMLFPRDKMGNLTAVWVMDVEQL